MSSVLTEKRHVRRHHPGDSQREQRPERSGAESRESHLQVEDDDAARGETRHAGGPRTAGDDERSAEGRRLLHEQDRFDTFTH